MKLKLTLGPVLYYWPREALLAFYASLPHSRISTIYLGEVVCGRRHELRTEDWLSLARDLAGEGPEVVLSTPALIESDADLRAMRRFAENGEFLVEANEMGAVRALAGRARFVAGPHLNVYNPETLAWLAELGACRWVAPIEMGREMLSGMLAAPPAGMQTELFAYGRMPLAFSARCFTARHFNLPKDDCQFRCLDYPDAMQVSTREGQDFLALNGIQTQSARVCDLSGALPEIAGAGANFIRLSPQSKRMPEVVEAFHGSIGGTADAEAIERVLADCRPSAPCNGYWHGTSGIGHAA